jgi:hypothetical protein
VMQGERVGAPLPAGTTTPRNYFQQGPAPPSLGVRPEFGNDNNNVSGKVGADWKPSEGMLAYLSISEGYRGVAFNGQAYNDQSELTFAKAQKLYSDELGLKTEFGNRRGDIQRSSVLPRRRESGSRRGQGGHRPAKRPCYRTGIISQLPESRLALIVQSSPSCGTTGCICSWCQHGGAIRVRGPNLHTV